MKHLRETQSLEREPVKHLRETHTNDNNTIISFPGLHLVLRAIDSALEAGFSPLKLNCVVMKGVNDDEILDFVEMTRDKNVDVRFIEYMPFDGECVFIMLVSVCLLCW